MEKEKDKRSLYDEALDRFRKDAAERHSSSKDLELLNEFLHERATPEETKTAAEALQGDAGKKYGSRKLGDVEIPESWIANILGNIENFVAAGDFLTKNAPESVGMAWYAIKLTLTAIHSNYDLYTFFGSGLSDISEIMIIVRHYDRLYDERSKPQWKPSPLVEKLFQDVIGAYAAVLEFSFAIKRHLTAGSLTRIKHGFKDFFGLSKAKFEDKLGAVASFKKKILEESQGAFQDKTLTHLDNVSTVLAGIEGTVRNIQDFQDTQKKLHEDAMAKFEVLIKGLDDIKASTKRKTQWDYAVQDFQAFQEVLSPLEGSFKVLGDRIDDIYPGTCEWVLEEISYTQWGDAPEGKILCVTGPEGSGKSYVVASIADRITRAAGPEEALFYVACTGSAGDGHLGNTQSYTADAICRTFLSQLYELAVQGEDHVGLLESCNAVFKKAKGKIQLGGRMRSESDSLPEFSEGFAQLASLLKKKTVLVLDGVDKTVISDKDQEELLRKLRGLLDAVSGDTSGTDVRILIGCASSTKLFSDLDLQPYQYLDVQLSNRRDIEVVLKNALKDVPGLSSAEQEAAKEAILEKARSRFSYVQDTAIPFMREPFQRPLSTRLEALPEGIDDVYGKALGKMSPNYLGLLRTALTWTLLAPVFPGLPHAREIMDGFQGTYDIPPESETLDGIEAEFPVTSRLELDQLRGATDPFLKLFPEQNGRVWVYESDAVAVTEYFIRSGEWIAAEEKKREHEHLCSKCGTTASSPASLYIDPKVSHLQMALTCLRHLNHPFFQHRAGLVLPTQAVKREEEVASESTVTPSSETEDAGVSSTEAEATMTTENDGASDSGGPTVDEQLQEAQDGYTTEGSLDDEDVEGPTALELATARSDEGEDNEQDDDDDTRNTRIRYELQYWPWHVQQAEALWPVEERENNSDWAALIGELDKFVFETPAVFDAWQRQYPARKDEYDLFQIANGPHKPLHVAAFLGLTTWTRHLLDRGEELEGLSGGYSPLQAAACSGGSLDVLKLLLEAGADVNAEHEAERSAFKHWLIKSDITLEGVKLMLDHGADPKAACTRVHYNALQYFAFSNRGEDPAILDLFMDHGVDIDAVHPLDGWRLPALHMLLMRREVPKPLLEAFVRHNADTNSENAASARPLQIVCTNGQVEILKILLQSEVLEIDDTDMHGTTSIHEAAFYGYSKCVQALLEHGADPDIADKINRIALHTAARKGLSGTVKVLLQYTKQINQLDHSGWSPFFCACLSNDEESAVLILDALIAHNIPLSEIILPTRSGRTAVRQAADHGFTRVLAKLFDLAASSSSSPSPEPAPSLPYLNAPDTKHGVTPLHRAALHGHASSVTALLTAGADPSPLDAHGRTPLALAHEQWSIATKKTEAYEPVLAALITADPSAARADADLAAVCAANGSVSLLAQLGRLGVDLNRPDRFGWTPLALAQQFGRVEAETFLKRPAAWGGLLPRGWGRNWPAVAGSARDSVVVVGRSTRIVHTTGKRVCVSADRPLPSGLEKYYFEVTLQDLPNPTAQTTPAPTYPEMAIGFCTLGGAALEFPGWWATPDSTNTARSWGYHSDTGGVYSSTSDRGNPSAFVDVEYDDQKYRVGDTVGAGVDLARGEMWFTRNGVRLEAVVTGVEGRLFPVVGLHEGICFDTNFGGEGDAEFRWKGELPVEGKGASNVVEVVVRGGKGDAEKDGDVQVVSAEVVVSEG
ncbi:ankyrin-3 [Dichotomopilus funicola]|uniref:Ankyrin-3 n=1 Tax=Dichotomopilus funicola TaxID=1934379 RepID=A0AAN6ZJX5_9PEZI|nr:ankyrin-3 [Dichotomopilus funicola]